MTYLEHEKEHRVKKTQDIISTCTQATEFSTCYWILYKLDRQFKDLLSIVRLYIGLHS